MLVEDSTDAASLHSLSAFAPDRASRLVWREHLEQIVLRDGEVLFRLLCERNETMQFVTACAAMLDPASGDLTWANAGHPLAAVVSATGGIDWLDGPRAAPLGVFEGTVCQTQHRVLGEGDTLLVYSDGVSESMNAESVVFGSGGMVQCLSGATESDCASTVARVVAAVMAHQGAAAQADDITLVALRRATQSSVA